MFQMWQKSETGFFGIFQGSRFLESFEIFREVRIDEVVSRTIPQQWYYVPHMTQTHNIIP